MRLQSTIETDIALAKRKMLSPRLSEQRLATKKLDELYAELEEFYTGKKPNSTKPKQLEKFHAEGTEWVFL